jgi:hypothetical protein
MFRSHLGMLIEIDGTAYSVKRTGRRAMRTPKK